jgi:hypothetical protein
MTQKQVRQASPFGGRVIIDRTAIVSLAARAYHACAAADYSAITLRFSDGPHESNFLKLAGTLTFYGR